MLYYLFFNESNLKSNNIHLSKINSPGVLELGNF